MIEPGDFVPNFRLPDAAGEEIALTATGLAGVTLAVVFADADSLPAMGDWIKALKGSVSKTRDVQVLPVIGAGFSAPSSRSFAAEMGALRMPVLFDPDGVFAASVGLEPGPGTVVSAVIDRNRRLRATVSDADPARARSRIVELCLDEAGRYTALPLATQAPALMIPRIFEPADCERFLSLWQQGEKLVNEVFDGERKIPIPDRKRRADVFVPKGEHPLNRLLAKRVKERIAPETAKAFQFTPRFYDVARVGRYDAADRGFFGPHRDIRNENKQYPRKFALTLNLNEGFVGGGLRFPEYGDHVYVPPAGGGVVFSVAVLHEALPVEQGQRFGLFLFFN